MEEKIVDYSIIVPVYFNEGSLKETYFQIKRLVIEKNNNLKGQVIFCEDGSKDNSFHILKKIKERNQEDNIKIIKFTRNFGQTAAIYAGLKHTNSKCYIIISADLQDPVYIINKFLDKFYLENNDIVCAVRETRKDNFFSRASAKIAFSVLKKIVFANYPKGGTDFILISKRVRDLMLSIDDASPWWTGEIFWSGFNISFIKYERKKRKHGKSQWTFKKKFLFFTNIFLGFSSLPIRFFSITGALVAISGFVYAFYITITRLFFPENFVYGWANIMVIILILSGIQMIMIGIIGEYVWKVLSQTRKRPLFVIDKIIDEL